MNGKEFKCGDSVITRKRLIREVNNDKTHNFYYEFNFRVYVNATHFFKGNFVLWFDTEDLAEFFDSDTFTRKQIGEYANVIGVSFLASAPTKEVTSETMRAFFAECEKTIENFNNNNR